MRCITDYGHDGGEMLDSHCEDMVLISGQSFKVCGIQNSIWLDSSPNTLIFHVNHNFNNAADHSVNNL